MIPQTDPKAAYLAQRAEIDTAITRVLEGGRYILGAEVEAFEQEFAAYMGAKNAVGVASGTDALILALKALGVGPGDGVVTVSHTAVATVAAIELTGATPILVDIDDYYTMDVEGLAATLKGWSVKGVTPKVVIPVHLYGQPADMRGIMELALAHSLIVLEDNSQAHGATLDGTMVGRFGRIAAYSLYPTKNLGAIGDAGVIATDDPVLVEALKALREYGWRERYISDIAGFNSRLDPLQAAILRAKLTRLAADTDRRRAIAARYDAGLAGVAGLELPATRPGAQPVYHQYVVATDRRDALQAALKEAGVGTLIHYPVPVHLQRAYKDRVPLSPAGLARTERAAGRILSLPMFPQLTDAQADSVIQAIKASL
ncbi:DegT/DnrJ/EryC1/StrS family aminotransferase [Oceanibaculum pacificum]|uniref:Erythromycin biosynthesis sensory transduction protein eryC1 n=1 Tax=Oceanibaculum pacificum TaxID=580166 RepID=A0A154WFI6_9PROT|nr:DegT/DnrJ/EryC1/StrS family aminotransferase [Oceanibaculum pacificum]KZD12225.1 erythromycin biosynthesis sensory transduction protein eryC1 [Oceanibaculum pacificum]